MVCAQATPVKVVPKSTAMSILLSDSGTLGGDMLGDLMWQCLLLVGCAMMTSRQERA